MKEVWIGWALWDNRELSFSIAETEAIAEKELRRLLELPDGITTQDVLNAGNSDTADLPDWYPSGLDGWNVEAAGVLTEEGDDE